MESRLAADIGLFETMPAVHAAGVTDFVVTISGRLLDTRLSHLG